MQGKLSSEAGSSDLNHETLSLNESNGGNLTHKIEVNAYQNEIDRLIGELENAVGKHAQVMHEFEKCDIDLEFMRNKCAALTEENKELLKQIVESDDKIANLNENYGSLEKLLEKIAILKSEKSQLNEALRKQTEQLKCTEDAVAATANENIKLKDDLDRAIHGE